MEGMKKHHRNHALIAAGITVGIGLLTTPIYGAAAAIGFYLIREVFQFIWKEQEFTREVIWRHFLDVVAAAVGAVPVAIVMWVLGL